VGEKGAVAGKTAVAGALLAAPLVGAIKGAEFLATHSAIGDAEEREASGASARSGASRSSAGLSAA
jgi:hypothetical protein